MQCTDQTLMNKLNDRDMNKLNDKFNINSLN